MYKQLFLATTFLCLVLGVTAQTVTTFTEGTPDDAIIVDSSGNIYCSNYVGDTVFKFTPNGEVSSFITGLNTPNGLAFNSNEELYVCDGQGNTIYQYDIDGNLLDSFPIVGHPSGIVKSAEDESMIFTLYLQDKILRLAPDGTITDVSLAAELNGPVGLAIDENGVLYVGNYNDRTIYRVMEDGTLTYIAQLPTDGGAYPNLGFITYGKGKLWGTTMGSDKIYAINPNGIDDYTLYAGSTQGSEDGDLSEATFNTPNGIYFDEPANTIYITDFGTKNLRIISDAILGNDEFGMVPQSFSIVPNPVTDYFEIRFNNENISGCGIKIYDVCGKQVYGNAHLKPSQKIDVSPCNHGVYLIEIQTGREIFREKLLK